MINNANAQALKGHWSEKGAKYTLYLAIFLIPLLFLPFLIHGFSQTKGLFITFIAIILFCLLTYSFITRNTPISLLHPLIITFILLLLSYTISSGAGLNFFESFWSTLPHMTGLLYYISVGVILVSIVTYIKTRKDWHKVFKFVIASGVLVSLFSTLGPEGLNLVSISKIGGSFLGNTSHAGAFLLFPIFLSVYFLLQDKERLSKRTKWLLSIGSAVMVLNPLFINFNTLGIGEARAAVIALASGLVLLALIYGSIKTQKNLMRYGLRGGVIIALLATLGLTITLFTPHSPTQQFLMNNSSGARTLIWKSGFQGFIERPIFGWGLEQFDNVNQLHFNPLLFSPAYGSETWFTRAHNTIVDQLVVGGVVGTLIYFSLYAVTLLLLWKGYKKQSVTLAEAGTVTSLLFAYYLQNLFFFDSVVTFFFFILILAYTISRTQKNDYFVQIPPLASYKVILGLGLITIFIVGSVFFVVNPAEKAFYLKDMLATQKNAERALNYSHLRQISPANQEYIMRFLSLNEGELIKANFEAAQTNPKVVAAQINALKTELEPILEHNPLSYVHLLTYVNLTNLHYIFEPSIEKQEEITKTTQPYVETLLARFNTNPRTYWAVVPFFTQKGELILAHLHAQNAVKLNTKVEQSQSLLETVEHIITQDLQQRLGGSARIK